MFEITRYFVRRVECRRNNCGLSMCMVYIHTCDEVYMLMKDCWPIRVRTVEYLSRLFQHAIIIYNEAGTGSNYKV